jgi:hypothetical protein
VFDAYTADVRRCRSSHILTGLPDAYGRGHIPGAVAVNWNTDLQDPLRRDFIAPEAFAKLQDQLGDFHVAFGVLVEGRIVNVAIDFALQVGHFFGALVHQQNDQRGLGVVLADALRDGFAR